MTKDTTGAGVAHPLSPAGRILDMHVALHGPQCVYPDRDDAITVTSHADAWALGDAVTLIPANTITEPFSIRFVDIMAISGNDEYQIELYENSTILKATFNKSTNADPVRPLWIFSGILPKNSAVTMKLANKTAATQRTCAVKVWYVLQ